jgi:hypothetical protein
LARQPFINFEFETSAKYHFVILSEAKDLVFSRSHEILRSLRSLRMTIRVNFAEVSTLNFSSSAAGREGDASDAAGAADGEIDIPEGAG